MQTINNKVRTVLLKVNISRANSWRSSLSECCCQRQRLALTPWRRWVHVYIANTVVKLCLCRYIWNVDMVISKNTHTMCDWSCTLSQYNFSFHRLTAEHTDVSPPDALTAAVRFLLIGCLRSTWYKWLSYGDSVDCKNISLQGLYWATKLDLRAVLSSEPCLMISCTDRFWPFLHS